MSEAAYLCFQATRQGQASHAHVHEIVKGLRRRGWRVEVFEPDYGQDLNPSVIRRLAEFARIQICLWLAFNRVDVIYVRNHFAGLPTSLLARLASIPQVQEVNAPYEDFFVAWPKARIVAPLIRLAVRLQFMWANAVVTVTDDLAKWVRTETGRREKLRVIPNGANVQLFHPNAEASVELPTNYAVFVGSLMPWQGIETLLLAVEDRAWPEDLALVVVGDGPAAENVRESAGRNEAVVPLGRRPYEEMPGIVAGSVASLIPKNDSAGHSSTGLMPLKLFESLAAGVPVVVTDFPGMADLVREVSCGIVVPPSDPLALALAVRRLWEDPMLRRDYGARGRHAVRECHSWDARAQQVADVLADLLDSTC